MRQYDPESIHPPTYRWQCKHGHRPCRAVLCDEHLVWIISNIKNMKPEMIIGVAEFCMEETCFLDLVDRVKNDKTTLEECGRYFLKYINGKLSCVTRERIRQIEAKGLKKVRQAKAGRVLQEFV
jgi:hypothetical protein